MCEAFYSPHYMYQYYEVRQAIMSRMRAYQLTTEQSLIRELKARFSENLVRDVLQNLALDGKLTLHPVTREVALQHD